MSRRWLATGIALLLVTALTATAAYFWPRGEPTPPVVPPVKQVLTVARSGDAEFRSIAAALRAAGPGTTIRIRDASVYEESLRLDNPNRLRDLTIEAPDGATIENAGAGEPVVTIEHTPGVVLRGLRIRAREHQHAVSVTGACHGLTLERLELTQPPDATSGSLVLWPGTRGTAQRPIVLRDLDVSCGDIGIVLVGAPDQPVSWVRVEDCRISGPGVHVAMEKRLADIAIVGNIFVNGKAGVSLGVEQAGGVQRLAVVHNTFFGTHAWLALEHCSLEQPNLRIANNLILQSQEIRLTGQDLAEVASRWFHNNWWERSAGINETQAKLVADLKNEVQLLSRDPASKDFLCPAPGHIPVPDADAIADRPAVGAR